MAPTPVLLPGKSHGWRSLEGCSPWGRWESDSTERLHFHFSLSCTGEGNGNPLQCSCLESPGDGGAWWAAVYGVAQSRTWLKRLRSSSSSQDVESVKTCFCMCKACAPDRTVNVGQSRATPESISPTPMLSYDVLHQTDPRITHFFLKPQLFNKKTIFTPEISFLGLNKLPSVSGMLADIRKKRTKLEKQ